MDADQLEPACAYVLEAMRDVRRGDDDVAGIAARRPAADCELGLAAPDDPCLGIGMDVQHRALAGLGVDQEERDRAAELLALEAQRTVAGALLILGPKNVEHRCLPVRCESELSSREDI